MISKLCCNSGVLLVVRYYTDSNNLGTIQQEGIVVSKELFTEITHQTLIGLSMENRQHSSRWAPYSYFDFIILHEFESVF